MVSKIILLTALLVILTMTGCSHPYVPPGLLVTNSSGPFAVTPNQGGTKEGTATAHGILGIISFGDASTKTAADEGEITKIRTVDVKSFNVFGIYYSYTTVVTGE